MPKARKPGKSKKGRGGKKKKGYVNREKQKRQLDRALMDKNPIYFKQRQVLASSCIHWANMYFLSNPGFAMQLVDLAVKKGLSGFPESRKIARFIALGHFLDLEANMKLYPERKSALEKGGYFHPVTFLLFRQYPSSPILAKLKMASFFKKTPFESDWKETIAEMERKLSAARLKRQIRRN